MPDKNKSFNTPLDGDEMIGHVTQGETYVPYLYKDKGGNVTAGIGFHIPREEDMAAYEFRYTEDGRAFGKPATNREKAEAHRKIKNLQLPKNTAYTAFNPFDSNFRLSKIGLEESHSREITRQKLLRSEAELKSRIPHFDQFPRPARQVMLDMQYNLGDAKFRPSYTDVYGRVKGWPNLYKAIDQRNWAKAAEESHSSDVQEDRNTWRKNKFLEAERLKNAQ